MPNFITSSAEMLSVALASDPSGSFMKGKGKEGGSMNWGKTRIGQNIVFLESLSRFSEFRSSVKENGVVSTNNYPQSLLIIPTWDVDL